VTRSTSNRDQIPVFRPSVGAEELEALREVLESGWLGLGPKTKEFEDRFAHYVEAAYAVGTNSCTAALHIALIVLGIGPGDEVITTPMTFVSTNHAILYVGATPVFCDIEPDTLNIDTKKIEPLITDRTRAIMAVHYGGHPCDMSAILDIAQRHELRVIEDAAHACGAKYKGRQVGSIGDATCFSFHAVKNLACGTGGMLTLHDRALAERARRLRWMGVDKDTHARVKGSYSWSYDVTELGYPYHMNDVVAAIGLAQLDKLDAANARRREIAGAYSAALANIGYLEMGIFMPLAETPVEKSYATSAFHNYVIKTARRDELMAFLGDRGIATGVHYMPNHLYDMYTPYRRTLPVAEGVWKRLVTLPLFPALTDSQVEYIIAAIKEFDT